MLILENPGLPAGLDHPPLFAGLQLILPGEVAPAHRHTQSALRFVIEGEGAYTAVDGERTMMQPGDFVITPSWTWHDHGNDTREPMVWLDGLDIPLVRFSTPASPSRHRRAAGDAGPKATARAVWQQPAAGRLEAAPRPRRSSTIPMRAPARRCGLAQARRPRSLPRLQAALRQSGERRLGDADDRHVHAAPAQGLRDRALPLDRRHRLLVVEGEGESRSATSFRWKKHDIFVVPSWGRSAITPMTKRCSSPSPIGRSRKSSASGASTAATHDRR